MAKKKKVSLDPLALIGDEPVLTLDEDRLSLQNFADTIAAVSLGTEGPFTIGVFGRWGHGKTSLLRIDEQITLTVGRHRTLGLNKPMTTDVPRPSIASQPLLNQVQERARQAHVVAPGILEDSDLTMPSILNRALKGEL